MKYVHIARYVASTLWSIQSDKLSELLEVLAFRAAGHTFTPEEIHARIGGSREPVTATRADRTAVLPIRGVIAHRMGAMDETSGGTSSEGLASMLRSVAQDDSIGTVIYDVDSPGGTVPGVAELAAEMYALRGRKKQIAVANGTMASAAYWLASQADEIVAIPSATVGSIGVFSAHEDLSAALEKEGVKVTLISAGKFKVEGNPFEPLTDEARGVLQKRVDAAYGDFVRDVARGRGVAQKAVREGYGEGRALSADDALSAGLIDRIGTLEGVLGAALGSSRSALRADVSDVHEHADRSVIEALDRARRLRMA